MPDLRFCGTHKTIQDASKLANYKPATFPLPDDFFVSVDKDGKALSRYSDDYWDFRAYGHTGFNFGKQPITPENMILLKQLISIHLYHMPLFPGKVASLKTTFQTYCKLCQIADKNSITINHINRFPRLVTEIIRNVSPRAQQTVIKNLYLLLREEAILGWKIADTAFIEKLAKYQIPYIPTQNAYIPPRIWASLLDTTELVLDDYERHHEAFNDAWTWIAEAYRYNKKHGFSVESPFCSTFFQIDHPARGEGRVPRLVYQGGAATFFKNRGIDELLNRWVGYVPDGRYELNALTTYATLVRDSAFTYILAHSIQRVSEGLDLRADCFITDDDPQLGKVGLLVGETTKTDPDSDARWVVPIKVEKAVKLLNQLNRVRLNTTKPGIQPEHLDNPYLMTAPVEPWMPSTAVRTATWSLNAFIATHPLVFREAAFILTEEDYAIAYQLTPRLKEKPWFKVGNPWSFNTHQLRRTLAVNLFASNVPDRVIQWVMKHRTVQQSYYYGRNYTRLRVNDEASTTVLIEAHRTAIRNLVEVTENSLGGHFPATGRNTMDVETLKLIEAREYKKLERLIKKGLVAARPTLLGFCMVESCEYGGVESAVHCAGVDGRGPCKDAIFSKKNSNRLRSLQASNSEQLDSLPKHSPRATKLRHENEAIEVYFHVTT